MTTMTCGTPALPAWQMELTPVMRAELLRLSTVMAEALKTCLFWRQPRGQGLSDADVDAVLLMLRTFSGFQETLPDDVFFYVRLKEMTDRFYLYKPLRAMVAAAADIARVLALDVVMAPARGPAPKPRKLSPVEKKLGVNRRLQKMDEEWRAYSSAHELSSPLVEG